MKPIARSMKAATRHFPLTIAGTLLLGVGIVFLALGAAQEDVYRASLGVLAIAVPFALAIASRAQAGRFSEAETSWRVSEDTIATLVGPDRCGHAEIRARDVRPWLFFRLIARVSGTVQVAQGVTFHFYDEAATSQGELVSVPLPVPLPGRASLTCRLEIRDVFGISRAHLAMIADPAVVIPPAMPRAPQLTQVVSSTGGEESTRLRSPEVERYYMREYVPGDRLRDINWKASSRVRQLFARVSPQTHEESWTLAVYLRTFAAADDISLEALAHAAYAKGWLVAFLRTVIREEPNVSFRVVTSRGVFACDDEDDIDRLSWKLADIWLEPESEPLPVETATSQAVVFTIPFDAGLASFAARFSDAAVHVFATRQAVPGTRRESDGGALHVDDIAAVFLGSTLLPTSAVRRYAAGRRPTPVVVQEIPPGTDVTEEVVLTVVYDRRSYEQASTRRGARGGAP